MPGGRVGARFCQMRVYKCLVTYSLPDNSNQGQFTILQGALSSLVANLDNKHSGLEPWNRLFQTPF